MRSRSANSMKARSGMVLFVVLCFLALLACPVQAQEDAQYWENVQRIQSSIRSTRTARYGMTPVYADVIKDGVYPVEGSSSSTYFRIAEAVLTVSEGRMSAEITIPSMSYLYVFMGTAAQARKAPESDWIGFREENGHTVFTIPVEALNKEIDCAAYSKARKKWYNRKILFDASSLPEEALQVTLPDYQLIEDAIMAYGQDGDLPVPTWEKDAGPQEEDPESSEDPGELLEGTPQPVELDYPDGEYSIEVNMVGGSGRASISSPTLLIVRDGKAYAKLLWSSSHYDYMIIGDTTYYNLTKDGGNSTFEIPIPILDEGFPVIADTTAMGDPIEIRYELSFYYMTIGSKGEIPQEAAKKVLIIAAAVLVLGGILNYLLKRKRKV
ncbi:MAG: hypothetical protein IJ106_09065 [Parasporobacterium sp.]|nr:hypothetical protein [Parasporobacterium sp.]